MAKALIVTLCFLILSVPLDAMNSQVTTESIAQMVQAGVDPVVIDYLLQYQTCAIGSQDVIKMTQAGLKPEQIIAVIETDRCRKPEEASIYDEIAVIERLKQAGLSDETILQYLDRIKSRQRVDTKGNMKEHYGNTSGRPPYPVEGSQIPEKKTVPEGNILIYEEP
jgi:hypothetical protein